MQPFVTLSLILFCGALSVHAESGVVESIFSAWASSDGITINTIPTIIPPTLTWSGACKITTFTDKPVTCGTSTKQPLVPTTTLCSCPGGILMDAESGGSPCAAYISAQGDFIAVTNACPSMTIAPTTPTWSAGACKITTFTDKPVTCGTSTKQPLVPTTTLCSCPGGVLVDAESGGNPCSAYTSAQGDLIAVTNACPSTTNNAATTLRTVPTTAASSKLPNPTPSTKATCYPVHDAGDDLTKILDPDAVSFIGSQCKGTKADWTANTAVYAPSRAYDNSQVMQGIMDVPKNAPAECKQMYTAKGTGSVWVQQACALPLQGIYKQCGGNGGQIVGPCGIVWMQTCPLGENCAPGKPGGKTRRRK